LAAITSGASGVDMLSDGLEVDQLVHRRQIGDEATELGLTLVLTDN